MQRVRVGLTGLACVFLLVLLAAAVLGLRRADHDAPLDATANVAAQSNVTDADAPKDPLAELGVAPGNPQPEASQNSASAATH